MSICVEASYGDQHYLNYKKDMEGVQAESHVAKDLPDVRIALFGLGRIGTIHLDNLRRNPKAHIVYCVEEMTERVNFVKNKWKLVEPETTFLQPAQQEKVFNDKTIDAVIICTPTFTHEELILKSLEAGKAVFCEKPLALTEEGIERCLKAVKKYSKPLLCAFNRKDRLDENFWVCRHILNLPVIQSSFPDYNCGVSLDLGHARSIHDVNRRRFDPGLRCVKARIDSGEIGKVHVIKTCSRDSPKPGVDYLKISGGIFHDCAVHDLDYICWVVGEYPESVSAVAHANFEDVKELGDYDTVAIVMKFPNGTLATIDLSRHAVYGYDQRVEVFGSKGMLTCGEQRPVGVKCHNEKGTTAVPIYFSFASRYQESYNAEMEHFLNVVQGLEECEVKPESILCISKIASACEEVVNSGKSVYLNLN